MSNYKTCVKCGAALETDDIAIFRKLVSRGADTFLCIDCLAAHFGCARLDIERLIEYYRQSGECTLFR